MLENKKAVIFDLDGTMVDSMWMWRAIDIEFLGAREISFPQNLQSCIEGLSFYETALYFKSHFPLKESAEEMMKIWNQMAIDKYRHEVPCKDGLIPFLALLREKGIKVGIATSNSRELTQAVLDSHGLHEYLHCTVTANEIKKGKPEPDIYLQAASLLEIDPKDCLVFEDICPGILAGKRAGMEVCAVYDKYSIDQDAKKHELADYYIVSYNELLQSGNKNT